MTRAELIQYITDNVYPNARNEVTAPMVRDSLLEIVDFLGDAATYNIGMVASGNQGLVTGGNVNTAIALALLPYYTAAETGQAIDDAIARIGLGQAAYKNIGQVAENNTDLVTGGQVYSAINTAITSAIKFQGVSDTPLTDGSTTNPIQINGQSYTAKKGDMVVYGGNEFLWVGNKWQQMGDESSYALKTISISGTGYLTGGGDLTQSRTLDISATAKGYIDHGEAAYNYFPGGVLDSTHLPSMYIGTTSVQFSAVAQNLTGISSVRATTNVMTLFEWDSTNSAWHFHGNIYTDGWFSGGGISPGGGGGGGGIDPVAMWRLLTNDPSLTQYDDYTKISADHINFPVTSVVGLTGAITKQQIAQALELGSLAYKSSLSTSDIPDLSGTYVTLAGSQTISGAKTFTNGILSTTFTDNLNAHISINDTTRVRTQYRLGYGNLEYLSAYMAFELATLGVASENNYMQFNIYGHDRILTIWGNENVGVGMGTTKPTYKFQVNGSINATTIYVGNDAIIADANGKILSNYSISSTAYVTDGCQFIAQATGTVYRVGVAATSNGYGVIQSAEYLESAIPLLINPSGGNVGVGGIPDRRLTIIDNDIVPVHIKNVASSSSEVSIQYENSTMSWTAGVGGWSHPGCFVFGIATPAADNAWKAYIDTTGAIIARGDIRAGASLWTNIGYAGVYMHTDGISAHDSSNLWTRDLIAWDKTTGGITIPYSLSVSQYLSVGYDFSVTNHASVGKTLSVNGVTTINNNLLLNNTFGAYNGNLVITDTADARVQIALGSEMAEYKMGFIQFNQVAANTASATNSIRFNIYGHDNLLTIAGNGNVGIGLGNTTGSYPLDINGTFRSTKNLSSTSWVSDTGQILLQGTGTNYRLGLAVTTTGYAVIQGGNSGVGAIPILLNPNGGNIGIGNTSPSDALDVTGVIHASTGIYTDGWFSGGGLASSSDRRLKKNIKNFAYTPKLLLAIRPREWDWKDGSAMVGHAAGFVAQEIEPIMPYAVDGTRNFKALFYDRFHALEISALQDHERRIIELEQAVKERDKKIKKLEKMLKLN